MRFMKILSVEFLCLWCAAAYADLPTGRDVIVGIIDPGTGLNWRHRAFRDPHDPQRSRVLYLATGREWDRTAIETALGDPQAPAPPTDADGHGTAVAGVAAGSMGGQMQGTAPEADIIMVSSASSIADAAAYIFRKADALGRRAVVCLSFSIPEPRGARQALSNLLSEDDRRIIVASAGNILAPTSILDAGIGIHWGPIALGASPTFTTLAPNLFFGDPPRVELTVLVREGAAVELGIGKSLDELHWRPLDTIKSAQATSDTLQDATTIRWHRLSSFHYYVPSADDDDNTYIHVYLEAPYGEWTDDNRYLFAARGEGVLHAWVLEGFGQEDAQLATHPDYRSTDLWSTVPYPANLPHVMAVGALADTTGWEALAVALGEDPVTLREDLLVIFAEHGRLLPDSGRGPSLSGAIKPDFVAPGMSWLPSIGGEEDYVYDVGTSIAAPYTAGVIAAFLERFPEATRDEVYRAFAQSARPIDDRPVPNNLWGYGQVDLAAALAFYEQRIPTLVTQYEVPSASPLTLHNAPNPFNAGTILRYTLERDQRVRLHIYNALGQRVDTLVDAYQTSGLQSTYWHPAGVRSGIYFARLILDDGTHTRKLLLVR